MQTSKIQVKKKGWLRVMGKQRLRNWIQNNPFFQTKSQFSKTAFIAMTTWFAVMVKYLMAGFTTGYSTTQVVVAGRVIPAFSWSYSIPAVFDYTGAVALLTLVFGLYFGNKFSPTNGKNGVVPPISENPAITK